MLRLGLEVSSAALVHRAPDLREVKPTEFSNLPIRKYLVSH